MKIISQILFAALIALSAFQGRAESNKDYQIRFGILVRDKAGNLFVSEETTNIIFKLKGTGFRFGCEVTPPDEAKYTYQSIVHFPSPPLEINGNFYAPNTKPNKDLVSGIATIPTGKFYDVTSFDPGDPIGKLSMDIFINGKLAKTITFNVRKD